MEVIQTGHYVQDITVPLNDTKGFMVGQGFNGLIHRSILSRNWG